MADSLCEFRYRSTFTLRGNWILTWHHGDANGYWRRWAL